MSTKTLKRVAEALSVSKDWIEKGDLSEAPEGLDESEIGFVVREPSESYGKPDTQTSAIIQDLLIRVRRLEDDIHELKRSQIK